MSKVSNLSYILKSCAEVLAAAVLKRCPDAFIVQGGETEWGFAYDFHFPSPISEEMIPYIEETFRDLIRKDISIRHREMTPQNAAVFFRHHQRYYPAFFAQRSSGSLVDVFEMDEFFDLCPAPYVSSTGELEEVKIIGFSKRPPIMLRNKEKPVIRIEGTLKRLLKERKEILKREAERKKLYLIHRSRGKDYEEVHRSFWLPEGAQLRRQFKEFWRNAHFQRGFEVVETQGADLLKNHEEFLDLRGIDLGHGPWRVAEMGQTFSEGGIDPWMGFYRPQKYFFDRGHIFCLKKDLEQELISSLQFLRENSKMLGFDCDVEIHSSKRENEAESCFKAACRACGIEATPKEEKASGILWKIADPLGRKWDGPFIKLQMKKEKCIITHSFFNQFERTIHLLLERKGEDLANLLKDIAKKRNFE